VLKSETLDRYAATWKSTASLSHPPPAVRGAQAEQIFHPFQPHDELASSLQHIIGAVEKLHAVGVGARRQRPQCEEIPPAIQAAYEQLDAAVSRCSVQLVRQLYGEQVFRSPVVEFCSLCAMTEHGNWVLAVSFTPFLSAVTHCMPLPAAQEPGNDCALVTARSTVSSAKSVTVNLSIPAGGRDRAVVLATLPPI
jgi:hypothetical protein